MSTLKRFLIRSVALCLVGALAGTLAILGQAPTPGKGAPDKGKGKGGFAQDPRVQVRTYHFEDTNEELPYSLYVSTKVKKDKKAPMIVTLHGLGATQTIMMTKAAVDLAEEGGYILVAPLGYNTAGWYGSPAPVGGRGKGKGAPDAAAKGEGDTAKAAPPAAKGPGGGKGFGGFGGGNNPPNLRELSEKDVMNVIELVKKEYKVDDKRMYLMGHSMGGAGTLYLGSKYANMWAAIAAMAPAAFSMQADRAMYLKKLKDAKVAVMIVHGEVDELVPVANSREWAATAKDMKMTFEYVEQPGISHGPVIQSGLKPIYELFAKHKR